MNTRPEKMSAANQGLMIMLLSLGWLVTAAFPAWAVEFATPPGQNLERQEAQLKENIKRLATSIVGGELIDVITHIGYARSGLKAGGDSGKVKLPGFNQFIDPAGGKELEIVPEFLRIRQVFVLVKASVAKEADSLASNLISQGDLNPRKGDFLKVVVVGGQGDEQPGGQDSGRKRRPGKMVKFPLNEPESTVHLLRARESYFKGNYDRALTQILKAVEVEPNSPQAYAMLGSLYFTINWKNLALKYWEKSLSLDPENREIEDLIAQLRETPPAQ